MPRYEYLFVGNGDTCVIHMASNENEDWLDEGVAEAFKGPGFLSFHTRAKGALGYAQGANGKEKWTDTVADETHESKVR